VRFHNYPRRVEDLPGRTRWLLFRMLLGGLIVTVLSGGAVAAAGLLQVRSIAKEFEDHGTVAPLRPGTITKAESGKPQTILLVGSDKRYGERGKDARSDTLMLVRIDPHQNATTMLSIPRDLAVEIPGHGLAKINDAYSMGGLDLTTRTVKALLSTPGEPFRINHAVATTFGGFVEAIDHLRCVHVDVDRRYYHTNAGLPVSEHWSEIDVRAGYQELCGDDALAYVRFRHLDNDIVRAARQQAFLRAAKDQLRHEGLLKNLKPLVRIFAKATETDEDLQSSRGLMRLARLAVLSSGKPVRQIEFPATFVAHGEMAWLGSYVTATPEQIQVVTREFLHPSSKPATAARRPSRARTASRRGSLVDRLSEGKALVRAARWRPATRMRVVVPAKLTAKGSYPASTQTAPNPRRYVLEDEDGRRHAAYRLVIADDAGQGQFYGVQGTTWMDPPILAGRHRTVRFGRHSYQLYSDGGKLRLVSWRTRKAVYWVSNTLSLDLSNEEMLGIARSVERASSPSAR
jgi:polyisoprenyl-teichoic acid--peptidoglycan teichoic acid transferase